MSAESRSSRRARRRRGSLASGEGLNLTPLLDVLFNLLFFFILATQLRDKDRFLDITLPSSSTAEERTAEEEIPEVVATEDGILYLNDEEVSAEVLEAELRLAVQKRQVSQVLLSSDEDLPWKRIVEITDICRTAGIRQVTPRLRPAS